MKTKNEDVALGILEAIDRARSGNFSLDELEETVWRLLEEANDDFPRILAGRVEGFVQELRYLQQENIRAARGREVDENHGADVIYNEVTGALGRFLG